MKSFIEYLNEAASYRRKGYINVKTGKMVLFPFTGKSIRPFHTEYVLKNANKFIRGGEDALLRKFADANGFEPEDEETISMWVDIKTGKVDRDPNLDSIIEAEGWRRVVFDEGISSVEPRDRREGQKLVRMILDKIPWSKIENLNVFDRGHLNDMTSIYSEEDAIQYAKTGRLAQRTSIGRTMAMFREEIDKAEFRAHWKKAPILTTGGGNVKQRNQFWDSYFKHFEDKYGPIPNRIKDAMRQADMKPNPSITHKGKKFSMRTGMDEMDLLYHVLNENTTGKVRRQTEIGRKMAQFREFVEKYEFMLPAYPEQLPPEEDAGGWAVGDPAFPIEWKGDMKDVYRKVMKHRKKHNPKYQVPKENSL